MSDYNSNGQWSMSNILLISHSLLSVRFPIIAAFISILEDQNAKMMCMYPYNKDHRVGDRSQPEGLCCLGIGQRQTI